MSFSTDDCKTLLTQDATLRALGLEKANWKRQSKKNGPLGVERVFTCDKPFPQAAKVVEQDSQLWIASVAAQREQLDDPTQARAQPAAGNPSTSNPATRSTASAATGASSAASDPNSEQAFAERLERTRTGGYRLERMMEEILRQAQQAQHTSSAGSSPSAASNAISPHAHTPHPASQKPAKEGAWGSAHHLPPDPLTVAHGAKPPMRTAEEPLDSSTPKAAELAGADAL